MTIICRAVFLVWGGMVFSSFLYAGVRFFNMFSSISKRLEDISAERRKLQRVQKRFGRRLPRVCKLTSIASLLGLLLCGMQVYSLHQMYQYLYISYITEEDKLWEWWICESLYRIIEIAMGCFLCCIIHVPARHSLKAQTATTEKGIRATIGQSRSGISRRSSQEERSIACIKSHVIELLLRTLKMYKYSFLSLGGMITWNVSAPDYFLSTYTDIV